MTELIPAAISSQLDQSGEERIHAAPYILTTRSSWVAPPQPFDNLFIISTNDNIAYKATNQENTEFTTVNMGGFTGAGGFSIFSVNGVLINTRNGDDRSRVSFDNGVVWQPTIFPDEFTWYRQMLYSDGEYLGFPASDRVAVSLDALTWSMRSLPNGINASASVVEFLGKIYVSGFTTTLHRSSDNFVSNFESQDFSSSLTSIHRIWKTANKICLMGLDFNGVGAPYRIFVSTTGEPGTWQEKASPVATYGDAVSFYQGGYLANINRVILIDGHGNTFYSDDDCDTFTDGPSLAVTVYENNNSHPAVVYSELNERLYFWRYELNGDPMYDYIFSTADGINWDTNWQFDTNVYPVVDFCLHNFETV